MKRPVLTFGSPVARYVEHECNRADTVKAELAEQRARLAEWFYRMSEPTSEWDAIGDVVIGRDRR